MATAGFDPGAAGRSGLAAALAPVAADMRAIFGALPARLPAAQAGAGRARAVPTSLARPTWRRLAAAMVAVALGGGALLGWWVSAAPQGAARHAAAVPSARIAAAIPAARVEVAAAPPAIAAPPTPTATSARPVAMGDGGVEPALAFPAAGNEAPAAPVVAPPRAAAPGFVPPSAYDRPVERGSTSDCGRFAGACTFADVRDAELQFRAAYAAADDAGADPRDLLAVRRRWVRLRERDGDQPDLLVTDYARLAGRLEWLAGAAGDAGPAGE